MGFLCERISTRVQTKEAEQLELKAGNKKKIHQESVFKSNEVTSAELDSNQSFVVYEHFFAVMFVSL